MSISKRSSSVGRLDRKAVLRQSRAEIDALAEAARREIGMPESPGLRFERADLQPNLKRIRERLAISQQEFANRFGLSVKTIRHWEQDRTRPDRPAVVLLKVIEIEPDVVARAVAALQATPPHVRR